MILKQKEEALQNGLISYCFPKKYFVQVSDKRIGQKFAIASKHENGGLSIHTKFMTYDEFNSYLFGYNDAKINKFK